MDKNTIEKILIIKAMEFIARRINCEDCFTDWTNYGIPDNICIQDDLNIYVDDDKKLEYFLNDENFSVLLNSFLTLMINAYFCKGISCAGVKNSIRVKGVPS